MLDDSGKASTQILALSPDDSEGARKMVETVTKAAGGPPGFPLLTDTDFKVINRYGIYNPEGFQGRKVPHPAVFVIDRSGKVAWKFLDTNSNHRAENADILKALSELDNQ